jgi:hypothetical protein
MMIKSVIGAFVLALTVSSAVPSYSESLSIDEAASSGLCTRAEVKGFTCAINDIKPDTSSVTEGKLLVLTVNVPILDCKAYPYGHRENGRFYAEQSCLTNDWPDIDYLLTSSPEECRKIGPALAMKRLKLGSRSGWTQPVAWRCE